MRFLISIFLVFSFSVNAQNLNQIDNNGQKQGLWKKSYENGNLRSGNDHNNLDRSSIQMLNELRQVYDQEMSNAIAIRRVEDL